MLVLLSCTPQKEPTLFHDQSTLHQLLPFSNPEPLLELEWWLRSEILEAKDPNCPLLVPQDRIFSEEALQQNTIDVELWQGDCLQNTQTSPSSQASHSFSHPLGNTSVSLEQFPSPIWKTTLPVISSDAPLKIDGVVELRSSDVSSSERSIRAEEFAIHLIDELGESKTLLYMNGTLRIKTVQDLLRIELSGSFCGLFGEECDNLLHHLELYSSIYPKSSYPQQYSYSVSGAYFSPSPHSFEGSWSIDEDICTLEPTQGSFGAQRVKRHELVFDGKTNCDQCAQRLLQGEQHTPFCVK